MGKIGQGWVRLVKVELGEIGYVHYFVDLVGHTVFYVGVGFNNSVISFFFSSLLFPKHPSCSLDYWRKNASYQSALPFLLELLLASSLLKIDFGLHKSA